MALEKLKLHLAALLFLLPALSAWGETITDIKIEGLRRTKPAVMQEMLEKFKKSVDDGIAEIIGTVEDSTIEKIEYNDDYSKFTVTVSGDELGLAERQAADELVMYGTLYHIYTGNDVDRIQVDYVSSSTGEIIKTADSGSLDQAY